MKNCIERLSRMGQGPLILAARAGHANTVKLLIENGINASLPDANGTLPLFVAVENGSQEQNGVELNEFLINLIFLGHDKVVDVLIEAEVDINMRNRSKLTALHVAIETGRLIVEF